MPTRAKDLAAVYAVTKYDVLKPVTKSWIRIESRYVRICMRMNYMHVYHVLAAALSSPNS